MQIILDSEKLINISYELKFRSIDYYLLFETMRKTGRTAASLINLKVKDVDRFIKDNSYFLGRKLCEELIVHKNGRDRDSPFFSSRKLENSGEYLPIPSRTLQSRLKELGMQYLGIENFGARYITKTFYYDQFRINNYDFDVVKKIFSSRNQYMRDLDTFLKYLDLSYEEYLQDMQKHRFKHKENYKELAKIIIDRMYSILLNEKLSDKQMYEYTIMEEEMLRMIDSLVQNEETPWINRL